MDKFIPYIGIPYKLNGRSGEQLDCWGLFLKLYRELYGIELDDYKNIKMHRGVGSDVLETEDYQGWIDVALHEVQEGDALILSNAGDPSHIGMVINKELMIHCYDRTGSVIESFRSNKWQSKIYKIRRHPSFN